jgi:maleate isomerase
MVRVIAAVVLGLTILRRMGLASAMATASGAIGEMAMAESPARVFLGMLTPSSNTILEPVTTAMLAGLPEVTAHFSRFKVTEIALSGPALAQFDDSEILAAAELLAHAKVNVIAWNGTSSGWLGFERDVQLCERITQATGIPACTAMLALNEILQITGAKRVGFVTPYLDDVQARINANYEKAGYTVAADRHLGIQDNFSFSEITAAQMRQMTRDVAAAKPEAISIICTNMRGAPLAEELEAAHGIPVYDTVSTTVWKSLRLAGVDTRRVKGWGRIFSV